MNSSTNPLTALRLDGKVAVVTGGARGIGRATVAALAGAGGREVLGAAASAGDGLDASAAPEKGPATLPAADDAAE